MSAATADCQTCRENRGRRLCAVVIGLLGFAFIFNGLVLWDSNKLNEARNKQDKERNKLVAVGLQVPPSEVKQLVQEVKALLEKHEALMDAGVTRELQTIHGDYPVYLREILALLRKANNEPPNGGEPDPEHYGVPAR